ncbi:hypothetical protein H0H81_009799 [Sphagnurus paluster]|uniref:HECT-type E3 ubiquitin transferase n=1 Tax=Sphagnurus paluster TaxID=117069 RepID=A0A9P7FX82_9AGAR|nr:hypothetical protein H0H81_009799 [Sphagnurus paluster]
MFTPFGDERKRKINLGGASSALSHTALIDRTRALRNERLEQQRRHESALRVQAWWRGIREARRVRGEMRKAFEGDVTGLLGLRCLAIIGKKDDEALAIWSRKMVAGGPDILFALARQPDVIQSWLVLIKQVAFSLLRSIADKPFNRSPPSLSHLKVLNDLLSGAATNPLVSAQITQYLLLRQFYALSSRSIAGIMLTKRLQPPQSRSSPALALLLSLATVPFSTLEPTSSQFSAALNATIASVLTIHLLPNRIPTTSLTHLSAHLPFAHLSSLDIDTILCSTSPDDKVNLIANLQVFVTPRYKLLDPKSLAKHFWLLTSLLNATPASILNPPPPKSSTPSIQPTWDSDSDSDSEHSPRRTRVAVVNSFTSPSPAQAMPSTPEPRTLKRITTLPSQAHLTALLSWPASPTTRPALLALLLAIATVWPADTAPRILAAAPALTREIYRGHVRGKTPGVLDPEAGEKDVWPALLLLVELYTKALQTMGDDEFFGTVSAGAGSASGSGRMVGGSGSVQGQQAPVARNPLTLDELTEWTRQLMDVAFALYWREDVDAMREMVGGAVRCTWVGVRERVTRCLVGIHARDSRKPFVPQDHWLVTSQIDVQSFVEAAIFEERELSNTSNANPTLPGSRFSVQTHSKRQLAYLSPRLGVLNNIPFAIPFDVRVSIFRHFVLNDAMARASSHNTVTARQMFFPGSSRTRVQVRRGSVAQDGFDRLAEADLKAPIEIAFIDQFGQEE